MTKEYDKRSEVTIQLDFPFSHEGVHYTNLTMRRPKTKDALSAQKAKGNEADKGILLLARLCDVSPEVISELDEVDAEKLGEQHRAFTGRERE